MIVAFAPEEEVEAFGEKLTLRLDWRAITTIEGDLNVTFPTVVAQIHSGDPSYSLLSRVIWACLRKHNPEVSIDQCLAMVMENGNEGAKVGFALNALLERAFPIVEDKEQKNAPKRRGRSKTFAAVG